MATQRALDLGSLRENTKLNYLKIEGELKMSNDLKF